MSKSKRLLPDKIWAYFQYQFQTNEGSWDTNPAAFSDANDPRQAYYSEELVRLKIEHAKAEAFEKAEQELKKEIADSFFGEFDDERTAGRHSGLSEAVKIIRKLKEKADE